MSDGSRDVMVSSDDPVEGQHVDLMLPSDARTLVADVAPWGWATAAPVRLELFTSRRDLVLAILPSLMTPAHVEIAGDLACSESIDTWWSVLGDGAAEFVSVGVYGRAYRLVARRLEDVSGEIGGGVAECSVFVGPELALKLPFHTRSRCHTWHVYTASKALAGVLSRCTRTVGGGLEGLRPVVGNFQAENRPAAVEVAWRITADQLNAPASSMLEALLAPASRSRRPWPPYMPAGGRFRVTGRVAAGAATTELLGNRTLLAALLAEPETRLELCAADVEMPGPRAPRSQARGDVYLRLGPEPWRVSWYPRRHLGYQQLHAAGWRFVSALATSIRPMSHGRGRRPAEVVVPAEG